MARVAVLLPVRNAAATVHAAAVSVLRGTYRDLTLIAVDDGSTDATAAVLDRLAARDRRVRVLRGPGEGIALALDRALTASDSELVARMDADDVSWPGRLEAQVEALDAEPSLAVVGARVRLFPRRQVRDGMRRYAGWLNSLTTPGLVARDLFVEAPAGPSGHAAAAFGAGDGGGLAGRGLPRGLRPLAPAGGPPPRMVNLPATLLDWREGPARLTRTDPRYGLDRHVALKCGALASGPLRGVAEVALWGAGETGRAFADGLLRAGIRVVAFVEVDRKKVGRTIRGAPVHSFEEVERLRGLPLLVAVGAAGARELIRAELDERGFVELRDYRCVA